jgi:hypothetical protein
MELECDPDRDLMSGLSKKRRLQIEDDAIKERLVARELMRIFNFHPTWSHREWIRRIRCSFSDVFQFRSSWAAWHYIASYGVSALVWREIKHLWPITNCADTILDWLPAACPDFWLTARSKLAHPELLERACLRDSGLYVRLLLAKYEYPPEVLTRVLNGEWTRVEAWYFGLLPVLHIVASGAWIGRLRVAQAARDGWHGLVFEWGLAKRVGDDAARLIVSFLFPDDVRWSRRPGDPRTTFLHQPGFAATNTGSKRLGELCDTGRDFACCE